ncbi:MAG: hypothetical protein H6739_37985 [Alphaproteobacteria bacterium]|nr:hypothetical protein [Alphaproteobacteria bacterium]
MKKPIPLGTAPVYTTPDGRIAVDTDNIRAGFAGDDFGYDDDGDFEGEDDDDDDTEDEFGGLRDRLRAGKQRRQTRRTKRRSKRQSKHSDEPHRERSRPQAPARKWATTLLGGSETISESSGGPVSVAVRLQHDFRARDITFNGSSSTAKVTSIFFGDQVVWSQPTGIPVGVFNTDGQVRGFLEGQDIPAGRDIVVTGLLTAAGTFEVTIVGEKPVSSAC